MKKIISIGGKERYVLFSKNALADLESILGTSIFWIQSNLSSIAGIRALAYVGLKWGLYDPQKGVEPKPEFTLLQVGNWMDEDPDFFKTKLVELMQAFTESLPKEKKEKAEPSPASPSPSTGS